MYHPRHFAWLAAILLIVAALLSGVPQVAMTQERGLGVTAPTPAQSGRYYALVIGNNNYAALTRLKTAEADAREVAALLKEAYGFETRLLLNATRGQIISALSAYGRNLSPDANLLIYYAGHGQNDPATAKTYWLPVDAELDDRTNWIIADEITSGIRAVAARHVLVVSDSCYSGTLTRSVGDALPRSSEREQFLRRVAAGKSRTLMASGGDEPVADGGGGDHSIFAAALLKGLREIDKAQFTGAELFRYYVEEPVAGRANQVPLYSLIINSGHESGDFVFMKVKADGRIVGVPVKAPTATVDPMQQELAFWTAIQNSTDAEDFKDYLARYPNGLYAGLARRRAAALTSAPPAGNTAQPKTTTVGEGTAANTTSAMPSVGQPQQMQNRTGIEFVWIPAGSFMMGSANGDGDEKPVHRVTISEGFYMGKYEVTQAQWQTVMGNNPSYFKGCANCPVERVSWDVAVSFLAQLNVRNDGYTYRLPSEAEWEYAARAETTGDYAGDLDAIAWYYNNSGDTRLRGVRDSNELEANNNRTHPVGSKQPNAFGLFDMHGNVWEWCQDWHHDSYAGAPTDGSTWLSDGEQKYRVLRGGSWDYFADYCRSASRHKRAPDFRNYNIGFRVVMVART
jgi:formylglycine-generating enzyme required for sulfatase activity